MREIDELEISANATLTAFTLEGVTRIDELVIAQNVALQTIDLKIATAQEITISGLIDEVHLDELTTVGLLKITGHACVITLDSLTAADNCTITTDRAEDCVPPEVDTFPGCN